MRLLLDLEVTVVVRYCDINIHPTKIIMCFVCKTKRLLRYDFLLLSWWKKRSLPAFVCGWITSRALVSTENTLFECARVILHAVNKCRSSFSGVIPLAGEYTTDIQSLTSYNVQKITNQIH
jgi:hypothetical protein